MVLLDDDLVLTDDSDDEHVSFLCFLLLSFVNPATSLYDK